MLDWNDLRFVLGVERAGSLKRAARDLAVDKATVGRRLTALETALGVRLFHRRTDGYTLTEKGKLALEAARRVGTVMEDFEAAIAGRDGPRAAVRVTAPLWFTSGVLLSGPPELAHPPPAVDVTFASVLGVMNLARREADVAIRNVVPDQMSMTARKLGELGSTMYAAREYLRARGAPNDQGEALSHPILAYESTVTFLPQLRWLNESRAQIQVAVRVTDTLALAAAVEAGLGLAVLPCFVGDARPSLVRVPFVGVHREKIWLVTPVEMKTAPGVRVVLDWVAAAFQRHSARLRGDP